MEALCVDCGNPLNGYRLASTENGPLCRACDPLAVEKASDVVVQLSGEDGNAFSIIGRVRRALRDQGFIDECIAFTEAAAKCPSYDALLRLCMETVDVR